MDISKIQKLTIFLLIIGLIPFTASVSDIDVLVVNDGHTLDPNAEIDYDDERMFEDVYNSSLNSIEGVNVEFNRTSDDGDGPSLERMKNFDMVLWYTLADYGGAQEGFKTLTDTDKENIKKYLDQGGTFYLTGHALDEEGSLNGPDSFFRTVLNARYRDDDASPTYWRFTDNGEDEAEKWADPKQVYDSKQRQVDEPYKMFFDNNSKVVLKGENNHPITGGLSFQLNTSTNPVTSLGVITDNCHHEQDIFTQLDQCGSDHENRADDGLRLVNNIEVDGGSDKPDIKFEKGKHANAVADQDSITVEHNEALDTRTVAGVAVESGKDIQLKDYSLDSEDGAEDGRIKKLESIETKAYDIYTFQIESNEQGEANFKFNESTGIAAITVTVDNTVEGLPVTDISVNNASNEISTSVESHQGDKVIDFIASSSDEIGDNSYLGEDLGDESMFQTFRKDGKEGEVSMEYSGAENMTHIVLNLRKDNTDAEYYVETDGYTPGDSPNTKGDYPDEYAHTLVSSRDQNYRTLVNSIGFESIQGKENRDQIMENTVRFLTGPVTNNTKIYSGEDIPESGADESRYTNNTLNIEAEGRNLQNNPQGLANARFLHSELPQGLKPTFESGFDESDNVNEKWSVSGYFGTLTLSNKGGVKKGKNSLAFLGKFGGYARVEMDDFIDTSNHQNLSLEFYVSDDPKGSYGSPEENEGENLKIEYKNDGGGWSNLKEIEPDTDNKKRWRKIKIPFPDDATHKLFKLRITAQGLDGDFEEYYDVWLIDELEINQGMSLSDETEGDQKKSAKASLNAENVSENLGSEDTGINVTYGVQFKDDSRQGYWGPTEEEWIVVDTVAPNSLTDVEFEEDYTDEDIVNITVKTEYSKKYRANLTRFTCNGLDEGGWSEWKVRNSQKETQKFEIDITDEDMGCSESQGNRTISVQTRDYAGNKAQDIREDWIVYDTERPQFQGAEPENNTAVKSTDEINITASDNFEVFSDETKYNAGHANNISFMPNETVGLNFEEEGVNTLEAWIYDKALNLRELTLSYDIDDTPPGINATPESRNTPVNNTAVKLGENFTVEAFDRNFDTLTANAADNNSFTNSEVDFEPEWAEGGVRNLEIWANDSAGNQRFKNYSYTVDGQKPNLDEVSVSNESFIQSDQILKFNFSDSTSGVDGVNTSEDRDLTVNWDLGLTLESGAAGENFISVGAQDAAGNFLRENFNYTVDDEAPNVSTNYSREDDSIEGWLNSDIEVEVNAVDNRELDTIIYGSSTEGDVSSPDETSETNTSLKVMCSDGKVCEKVVIYNANDSAGNYFRGSYKESETISIDKQAPDISIETPSSGSTQSGTVNIEAEINDPGIGVEDANFTVYNKSDTSQVFESGELNESSNWSYEWNSEQEIDQTEDVKLEVEAEDKFEQKNTKELDFTIENERTTVTITRPDREIVNDNFELSVEANRPGDAEDLKWHNLTIKNDGKQVYTESEELNGDNNHIYERSFDTSNLDGDGNYTLNTTAESDETGEYATSETWFYLDTEPPEASIESDINNSWTTGELEVNFEASDSVKNDSLEARYRNGSEWKDLTDLEYSEQSFNFDTEERCQDTAETKCGLKLIAEDAAGNQNTTNVQFKVDNTPPNVNLIGPLDEWQNSDFDVSREISDNVVETESLECSVRVNSGEWQTTDSCNTDYTAQIPGECGEQGKNTCQIDIKASHPELPLTEQDQEFYSIDTDEPEIFEGPEPSQNTIINGSQKISLGFQDDTSGISYSKWDEGKGLKELERKEDDKDKFEPDWTDSGNKTLEIFLNDTADNLRTENYEYVFDNKAPILEEANLSVAEDQEFKEVRVYRGEDIQLEANVSENIKMKEALAEIEKQGKTWNKTLNLKKGNLTQGLWTRNLANESTGLYTVEAIYLKDEASNNTVETSNLPEFRVINYSQDLKLDGKKQVSAGKKTKFNYTIDLNRTQGEREFKIYVPPSRPEELETPYFDLDNISCQASGCNVTDQGNFLNLTYTGDRSEISITGESEAFKPDQDTTTDFTVDVLENTRKSQIDVNAPKLEINKTLCEPGCTVDQFEEFNITLESLNNKTSLNTGKALNASLRLASKGLEDKKRILGDMGSGESLTEKFTNLTSDEAGNYSYDILLEDKTGTYRDSAELDLEFLDAEKPNILDTGPSSSKVNVNGSIDLKANLTDNVGVKESNITIKYNGTSRNLSLSRDIGNEWINSFNDTSEQGVYELKKIYVSDKRGNINISDLNSQFKVTEMEINSTVSKTEIKSKESVNFTANITGNSTEIEKITVNSTTPEQERIVREYTDVDLNNTLEFDDFENSGNYSFNITAEAGIPVTNQTSDVFVEYGNSTVKSKNVENNETLEIPETISSVSLDWSLRPVNGSLKGLTLQSEAEDSEVLGTPANQEIDDLIYSEGSRTEQITVTPENTGKTNLSTALKAEKGGNSTSKTPIEITEEDSQKPRINSFNLSDRKLNINETIEFSADITDNSVIKNATLSIKYPENGSNHTENLGLNKKYTTDYGSEFDTLNETGNYSVRVKAYDISENRVETSENFTVTDEYTVEVDTDQSIYMKEETADIRFNVLDAGGDEVQDYTINSTIEIDGSNRSLAEGENLSGTQFRVKREDPPSITRDLEGEPVDYVIYANVSREGNRGSNSIEMPVHRVFDVNIDNDQYVAPGEEFRVISDWKMKDGDTLPAELNGFILCDECPSNYKQLIRNVQTRNYVQTLKAPNETGTYSFTLRGSLRGNSESQNPTGAEDEPPFSTFQVVTGGQAPNQTSEESSASGGGGFSGGDPTMEISRISPGVRIPSSQDQVELAVNTNIAGQCVYSRNTIPESVSFDEANEFDETGGINHSTSVEVEESLTYSYNIMCASENVNQTTDIIFSKGQEELTAFQPSFPETITPGNSSITQKTNGSGIFELYNNQSQPLDIDFSVESDCCNGTVLYEGQKIKSSTIDSGEEKTFSLSMYAPLNVKEGIYSATLSVTGPDASRERSIDFEVDRNDVVQNYTQLVQKAIIINSSINEYSQAGVDTSKMREALKQLENNLKEANKSIQKDDLEGLQSQVQISYRNANKVDKMLEEKSLEKYIRLNWWKWGIAFTMIYVLIFLTVMVGIPYYRIQTELTRINSQLKTAIDARKKGEKQYFQRKIDKDTFNKMMTERQNEVLQLRGQKEDLKEELDGFLKRQLTLENYLKAPWKGMDELEKWWAANKRARNNLNQDTEEDSE